MNLRRYLGKKFATSLSTQLLLTAFLALAVMVPVAAASGPSTYHQTNLVSDLPGMATFTDPKLVNPWGITHPPTGPWWVNKNGTGFSQLFNGAGEAFPVASPLVVTIPPPAGNSGPATPTGIIFNGTKDFELTPGFPARFIFVTEDGTISGWNPNVPSSNSTEAVLKVSNAPDAVYKGAAMALNEGILFIYVANFRGGTVDVFDTNFQPVTLEHGAFKDKKIPEGFAPFNVMNIDGILFVTYAKQDEAKHDDVAGPGNGFVTAFAPSGKLLFRLEHGPWMNSPWGVALAPRHFGEFSRHLLVGNFGSGNIAAFDLLTGKFAGLLKGEDGKPVTIDGLWGIGFGNGATAGPLTTLFFAAGINGEQDGLFGTITPTTIQ